MPPRGIDHHARDMTATLGADLSLGEAQAALAQAGQWLPIDGDPAAPLGQLVERNSTGPLRLGYGAWRDLLLGVQFYNGEGELITAGGRTVKNVAGYDLTKFMVGNHGVFGKIATITTRTYLRPAGALLARFDATAELLAALLISTCRPQWAMRTPEALWCGYVGTAAALAHYEKELPQHRALEVRLQAVSDDMAFRAREWRVNGPDAFHAAVPPARISEFVAAARIERWVADAAFGVVIGPYTGDEDQRLSAAARGAGGSIYYTGPGFAPFYDCPPPERELLHRLKKAFDPNGRLLPLNDWPREASA